MKNKDIIEILRETGAIMEGHFKLTSGMHSSLYVEKFNVLQYPKYTEEISKKMATFFKDKDIETVVGPMTGGILLAHEVGKTLGARSIFTERVNGKMTFRRGFSLNKGEKIIIVEDIVTTGGSIKEVIEVVKSYEADIIGIVMIVDRSSNKLDFDGIPYFSLLKLEVEKYDESICPLCKKNIPLTKRGSTGK